MAWDLVTFPDLKQRNPKKAVEAASKAVAAESRNANYWHTLGVAQYRDGQYAAALQSFDKSMILRDGGDGFDWYYVALAHWKLHNSQQAIDYLHKAQDWKRAEQVGVKDLLGIDDEAERVILASASQQARP
jgi:uncharacterized protein HemY